MCDPEIKRKSSANTPFPNTQLEDKRLVNPVPTDTLGAPPVVAIGAIIAAGYELGVIAAVAEESVVSGGLMAKNEAKDPTLNDVKPLYLSMAKLGVPAPASVIV